MMVRIVLKFAAATAILAVTIALPAMADEAVPPAAPAAVAPAPAAPAAHKRQSLQQHFEAANTSHDGQLTQGQAVAAKWSYVDKHFTAIDKSHKGYVTVDDIHAYAHLMHAVHHVSPKPAAPAVVAN